jgi:transposase
MEKVICFEQINFNGAGIDIGSSKFFVSVDGQQVENFETYTNDYHRCIEYLKKHFIEKVAMEATGVYWIALYSLLEQNGIKVCLVNPKETKPRRGHKTDVQDCRWIQRLFSAGLLKESFIPEGLLLEVRYLVRERMDLIQMGGTYVNKMQRCLELMNIKLTEVISQVHGKSGMHMMKAIIAGQRDPQELLLLCDERIISKKSDRILQALEGNYNTTYLFMLEQNIKLWEEHQKQIIEIDKQIEGLLLTLTKNKTVNVTTVSGINDYTLLRLVGETGSDMARFPSEKHFVSWCGLAPGHHKSGKVKRKIKTMPCNKAGQIFKEIAQGLENSKTIAIGGFIRKLKTRKNAGVAYKAGARKLAEAYYNALTKGTDYVEQGIKKYEQQLQNRELAVLKKLAKKHNMQIIEKEKAA